MGGLAAAASSSILAVLMGYGQGYLLCMLLTVFVLWRHRANISRIRAGTEPKIGQKD
jgi:glycerol-3-phosphate acyltransferase PlsY